MTGLQSLGKVRIGEERGKILVDLKDKRKSLRDSVELHPKSPARIRVEDVRDADLKKVRVSLHG